MAPLVCPRLLSVVLATALLGACESSEPAPPPAPADSAVADAAPFEPLPDAALAAAADSAAADASADTEDYVGIEPPANGFRVRTKGRMIPAKSDEEYCEIAELPGGPEVEYIVSATEAGNARGSHHLIIQVALPGTPAHKMVSALPIGDQRPCVSPGIEYGEGLFGIGGAQSPYAKLQFPKGVGLRLRGGQRVVFDYHYFNYGDQPLLARSALGIHLMDKSELKTPAGGFAFTNMTIDTPPGKKGAFMAACKFKHDAMVMGVRRHTHTKGTDFNVWFEGGARHGQEIWKSRDWEHDVNHDFPEPVLVKANEGFKFECGFDNQGGTKPLRFGISAADEMCILNGTIWSPTTGAEAPDESCVITWVGPDGIGHDARDNGGFPKAELGDALSCAVSTFGFSFVDSCVGCLCDHCGSVLSRCAADPDCKAIQDCNQNCKENCGETCEPVMIKHSSAVGMVTQVGLCINTMCPACTPAPASDAGVP